MKTKNNPKNVAEQSIIDAIERYLKKNTDNIYDLHKSLESSYKNFTFVLKDKKISVFNNDDSFFEIS